MSKTYLRTEEIREKMRRAQLRYLSKNPHPFKGKKQSLGARRKISEGMIHHLKKLKAEGKPHFLAGRKISEEAKQKQSQSMKGKMAGPKHWNWKNGRKMSMGYIYIKQDGHPGANSFGYIREHRLVMEKMVGRILRPTEFVHHINGNKTDNRPENLMLFPSNRAHSLYRESRRICPHCGGKL